MSEVYLDTSALLALLDRDDQDHLPVAAAVARLLQDSVRLVTTSYTLVEAGALVRRRLGIAAFKALGDVIDRAAEIVWVDETLHRAAWRNSAAEGRKGASLVDWVGFLVMKGRAIDLALAIDEHFRREGFSTLP